MIRRGFTLLEILVATALFALLMGAYYSSFTDVLLLEEYARNQRSFATVGPAVLDLIEDDMLSMHTHPVERGVHPFRGEDDALESEAADRLSFVARRASVAQEEFFGRDSWTRSPINEVGYRLGRGNMTVGNLRRLYRREDYYVDESPLAGGDFYEVYDRIVSLDVAYAGYRVEEEARESTDTLGERELDRFESWDSEERKGLPTAVIVTLVIEAPQITREVADEDDRVEGRDRRTYVRVIRLVQADDVEPPAQSEDANPPAQPPEQPAPPPGDGDGR